MVQYNHLEPSRSEIRVLTLLGGKPEDDVKCTLGIVSLDEKPEFAALSYVWGDASIKRTITVDGEDFSVTTNLDDALRALRHRREPRTLWVDAICINQVDNQEKSSQIPLMGRLYTDATSVVIWLGPSTRNIELAVSWAQTYVAKTYGPSSAYWLKLDAKAKFSKTARRERDWATLGALEGYFEGLSLPYWSRMWTFQEFRLPPREPACQCGQVTFYASSMLGEAEQAIHTAGFAVMRQFAELVRTWSGRPLTDDESATADEIHAANRRLLRKSDFGRKNSIVSLARARRDWRQNESPLLYLLITTAERQCFAGHDKMYALYGMVPAVQDANPPDYDKPLREVVFETAVFLVRHERGPLMWSNFGLREDRLSEQAEFPSWVPDFAEADQESPKIHRELHGRVAERLRRWDEAPPAEIIDEKSTTLRLWARNLGHVKVLHRFEGDSKDVLDQIRRLVRAADGSDPEMRNLYSELSQIRKPNTLGARMASMCFSHHVRRFQFEVDQILETLFHAGNPAESSSRRSDCWYMIEDASGKLAGKVLFATENGSFGIGVGGIRDGDILVVPPQVRLPLVLTKESPSDGSYHRMVGTATVDGVIDSTFLDEELVASIEEKRLEEFLIH